MERAAILCKGPPGRALGMSEQSDEIPLGPAGRGNAQPAGRAQSPGCSRAKNSFLSACGRGCCPVQGPARQGTGDVGAERRNPLLTRQAGYRGMHSPQGEHNPLVAAGQKTVFFPLAEEAAVLCKGPPGRALGMSEQSDEIPF